MTGIFTLLVDSADHPIMAEVARLGVAMGYRVIGVSGSAPDLSEPWQHGVEWHGEIPSISVDAIAFLNAPKEHAGGRTVVLYDAKPGAALASSNADVVLNARFDALPIEQLAMATLRAAVETEHCGELSHDEVAYLGDAMMLQ